MKGRASLVVSLRVAGMGLLTVFAGVSVHAQGRRFERHFTAQGKPVVTVQNAMGRIQVRAWDKQEVMILGQRGSTNVEVDTERVGNRIEIAARVLSANTNRDALRADYDISVRAEAEHEARSDSGDVTGDSVSGAVSSAA